MISSPEEVSGYGASDHYATFKAPQSMTFAIYIKHNSQPTRVLYSHLTEQQAQDEVERIYANASDRGLPCSVWSEQHHPDSTFVIN